MLLMERHHLSGLVLAWSELALALELGSWAVALAQVLEWLAAGLERSEVALAKPGSSWAGPLQGNLVPPGGVGLRLQ